MSGPEWFLGLLKIKKEVTKMDGNVFLDQLELLQMALTFPSILLEHQALLP